MNLSLVARYLAWIAVAPAAIFAPSMGEPVFHRLEKFWSRMGSHRIAASLGAGMLVLLVRGALLPLWPIPQPAIYDEFSYILQADTFTHGRLTNPTHKLWQFFESPYVLQHPTYASKYPPGQSLALAAGQVIFGDPWFGVWLSCGAMVALLVWAMQAWVPPAWALLGGVLALRLAIGTYWMNSFWGGAVAAAGGALLLGGYARVVRKNRPRYAIVMGAGIAILANTRPYEGLIFCLPILLAFFLSRPRPIAVAFLAAVLIPAFAATGYYNKTITGNAFQMPFTEYADQYVDIPLFSVQSLRQAPVNLNPVMVDLHQNWEPKQWAKARTWELWPMRWDDWKSAALSIFGSLLIGLLILVSVPWLWRDRRMRLPLVCAAAALAGSLIEIRYYTHYAAPALVAFFILEVQALRHLRHWKPVGRPVGRFLSRALPMVVIALTIASPGIVILRGRPPEESQPPNARRGLLSSKLRELGGKHVVLVVYSGIQSPHEEWVYNGANIDSQDVIWAHDLGPAEDIRLLDYYKGRKIWLFQPDLKPPELNPYR